MTAKLAHEVLQELRSHLGEGIEILADKMSPRFQEFAKRWTDIDRQTPAAIVLPDSVPLIQKTVWIIRLHASHACADKCCGRSAGPISFPCPSSRRAEDTANGPQSEKTASLSI